MNIIEIDYKIWYKKCPIRNCWGTNLKCKLLHNSEIILIKAQICMQIYRSYLYFNFRKVSQSYCRRNIYSWPVNQGWNISFIADNGHVGLVRTEVLTHIPVTWSTCKLVFGQIQNIYTTIWLRKFLKIEISVWFNCFYVH